MVVKYTKEQVLELKKAVLETYHLHSLLWDEGKKENSMLVHSQYEEMEKALNKMQKAFKWQSMPKGSQLVKKPCHYKGYYTQFNKDRVLDLAITGNPQGKGKIVVECEDSEEGDGISYRISGCPIGTKIYNWWSFELEWKLLVEVDSNYVASDNGSREELERKPSLLFAKNFGNKEQVADCEEMEEEEKTLLVEKTGQRAFRFVTGL